MLFLIQQNFIFLLLAAGFALLAGWALRALRALPEEQRRQAERDRMMREVLNSAIEGGGGAIANGVSEEQEREMERLRMRAEVEAARATELQQHLEAARSAADDAHGRAAEVERQLDRVTSDNDELQRLRTQIAEVEAERARMVDVEPTPLMIEPPAPVAAPVDDEVVAQSWRLRYFEQRVRYLENQARSAPAPLAAPASEPEPAPVAEGEPQDELLKLDWRARYAEARARHLEEALREVAAAPPSPPDPRLALIEEPAPQPAPEPDHEAEDRMRWRLRYLEKRLAYLQEGQAAPEPVAAPPSDDEAARLKWRTHYLEMRIRQLETDLAAKPEPAPAPVAETPAPAVAAPEPVALAQPVPEPEPEPVAPRLVPVGAEERPPSLPAPRDGAPDDFTLIDDVSPMRQRSLNFLGIYHFEQIAAWTPANIAWVDQYLRLNGQITQEEWVEQAADLARDGVAASRRMEEEPA